VHVSWPTVVAGNNPTVLAGNTPSGTGPSSSRACSSCTALALAFRRNFMPDALTAEALAAKEGLELAAELGLNKILLEVDCQALSNFLQGPQPFTSSIGGLCFDILELGKSFASFSNRWIRRDANSVAHACASLVSAAERAFFWIDCIPNWLVMLAASDCTLAGN